MRLNRSRLFRIPAAFYTEIFKNVPLLAIIFLTYFGLPTVGVKLQVFEAGVLSLVLFMPPIFPRSFARPSPVFIGDSRRRLRRSVSDVVRRSAMLCCHKPYDWRCRERTRCSLI